MKTDQQKAAEQERSLVVNKMDGQQFLSLPEKEFYDLVDRDVRTRLVDEHLLIHQLRDPVVLERWYQTLLRMKKAVEGTIAARAAECKAQRIVLDRKIANLKIEAAETRAKALEAETEQAVELSAKAEKLLVEATKSTAICEKIHVDFLNWRAGSLRFKTGVEERLSEASWRRKGSTMALAQTVAQQERNAFGKRLSEVTEAVKKHRAGVHPDDASEVDDELYRAVGLIAPNG